MDPNPISDYWIDDVGLGSDGELRCAIESFCDVIPTNSVGFQEGYSELGSVLDPGRPPRFDKAGILTDAARLLVQMKSDAEQLKESNEKLQETIKELKVEKNELRDEKTRLKEDKERLEQQVKATSAPPPAFVPHPMTLHPAVAANAAFAAKTQSAPMKNAPFGAFPGMTMWQWLPPAVLDTTQDSKLWSPHA